MSMALAFLGRFWPYMLGGVALLGAYLWIDHRGYARGYAESEAKVIAAAQKLAAKADRVRAILDQQGAALAVAQRDQQTETKEIYHEAIRIVDRPIYLTRCVDADGVGLLDRAATVANRGLTFSAPDRAGAAAKDATR